MERRDFLKTVFLGLASLGIGVSSVKPVLASSNGTGKIKDVPLDILIGAQQSNTKYKALNLQTNITIEQKKVLERVFDILCGDENHDANALVTKIIKEFVPKTVAIAR